MDPRLHRTKFAARAATLADQFDAVVADYRVGAHRGEMTAPEASTGGGVQALQHIRLVPAEGTPPGARTYVVGNANRSERVAELRTLGFVDQVSRDRFGESTGFDPEQYEAFVTAAGQFLEMFGLVVTRAEAPLRLPSRPPRASRSRGTSSNLALALWTLLMLALGVGVGILAGKAR